MPAVDESSYEPDDTRLLWNEEDYSKIVYHFRQKNERSSVISLTNKAGLRSATEAYFFFQELQAGLASIRISGRNVDELRCRLDWCSLVLGMWVRRKGNDSVMEEWMSIMESWMIIIESTASMAICFALPTRNIRRGALEEDRNNRISRRMLRGSGRNITKDDEKLVNSVLRAARLREWTTPLRHDAPFRTMIAHLRRTIRKNHPKQILLQQRRRGIEASDFEEFVADIENETHTLLGFLTSEEKKDLEHAFVRQFEATLSIQAVLYDLRYLQICKVIQSQWLLSDHMLRSEVEEKFQKQAQELFGNIASQGALDWNGTPRPPIDKELSEVLALGGDIHGDLNDRAEPILHHIAGFNCPVNSFRALVAAGAPYKNDPENDASPLHAAAQRNNTDVIAFLLDRALHSFDININARDQNGQTALHYAARDCCIEAIDMLLQQPKIEIDARDSRGFTPFLLAAKAGGKVAMSRLLRSRVVNCYHSTEWSENALHLAASCPRDNSLLYVLRHVRDVNAQDWDGSTPLHKAVEINSGPNVSVLLTNGANPSITDNEGFTPFARACKGRHLGPMKRLLRASHGLIEPIFSPVKSLGSHYRDDPQEGFSPVTLILHDFTAATQKALEHVRLALKIVLAAKPDLEVCNSKGQSVLSKVISTIGSHMLQELLHAGADVHSRDHQGKSILHYAIKTVDGDTLKTLLHAGMDVNCQDNKGNTPMHKLLGQWQWRSDLEKLRILLEWGANPDIKNYAGDDPITANLKRRGEAWIANSVRTIRDHKLQVAKARKALA